MIRIFYTILVFALLSGCAEPDEFGIPRLDFDEFSHWLQKDTDTVYVVNFWATWCKPCVEELPDFEKLHTHYEDAPVKVVLVSLDFPSKYEEQLIPFVRSRQIQSQVIHLTEVNANKWIDKVDASWSGAIPATLIYRGSNRTFFEKKLNFEELKSIIETKL